MKLACMKHTNSPLLKAKKGIVDCEGFIHEAERLCSCDKT